MGKLFFIVNILKIHKTIEYDKEWKNDAIDETIILI
jgi:hypothetical protein